jgi:hypothetical protein
MAYHTLPKFVPEARHVVSRAFTFEGRALAPGDAVPSEIPLRRLRQLYETRKVTPVPEMRREPAGAPAAKRKGKH